MVPEWKDVVGVHDGRCCGWERWSPIEDDTKLEELGGETCGFEIDEQVCKTPKHTIATRPKMRQMKVHGHVRAKSCEADASANPSAYSPHMSTSRSAGACMVSTRNSSTVLRPTGSTSCSGY